MLDNSEPAECATECSVSQKKPSHIALPRMIKIQISLSQRPQESVRTPEGPDGASNYCVDRLLAGHENGGEFPNESHLA